MSTQPLSFPLPSLRSALRRLRAGVRAAWQDWQGWRRQWHAARRPAIERELSARVLDDLGAPPAWCAAAERWQARALSERSLLRLGIVSGLGG